MAESDIGDLSTAFNTGLTIGAFTWGLLVDILGVSHIMARSIMTDVIAKVVLQYHLYLCFGLWFPIRR
jgi:hypothetical protein